MGGDRVLHRLGLVAAIASTYVIGSKVALSQTPKKGGTFFWGRTRRSVASAAVGNCDDWIGRTQDTGDRGGRHIVAPQRHLGRDEQELGRDLRPHDPSCKEQPPRQPVRST